MLINSSTLWNNGSTSSWCHSMKSSQVAPFSHHVLVKIEPSCPKRPDEYPRLELINTFLLHRNRQMSIFVASNWNRIHCEDKRAHQKAESCRLLVRQAMKESRLVVESYHSADVPDSTTRHARYRAKLAERHWKTIWGQILIPFRTKEEKNGKNNCNHRNEQRR